jgi:hypothetical protein
MIQFMFGLQQLFELDCEAAHSCHEERDRWEIQSNKNISPLYV